jgi:hypothetical protein
VYEVEGDYYTIDNWSHRKNAKGSDAPYYERLNGPFHSVDELKMSASHGNTVMGYRFFNYNSIPFHTRFKDIWNSLI